MKKIVLFLICIVMVAVIISGLTKVGEIVAGPAVKGIADIGNFENYFNN